MEDPSTGLALVAKAARIELVGKESMSYTVSAHAVRGMHQFVVTLFLCDVFRTEEYHMICLEASHHRRCYALYRSPAASLRQTILNYLLTKGKDAFTKVQFKTLGLPHGCPNLSKDRS